MFIPAAVLAEGERLDPQADVRLADMAPDPFIRLILLDRAVERYSLQEKRSTTAERYAKLPLQAPGFEKAIRIATLDQNDVAVSTERTVRMKKTIKRLMNKRAAMDPVQFGALVDDAVESWRECLAEYAEFAPGREAMIQGLLKELQAEVDQANQERAREAEQKKLEQEKQQSTQSPLSIAASSPYHDNGADQLANMNVMQQQMQQQMAEAMAQQQRAQEEFLEQQAMMQMQQQQSELMRQQREMAVRMSQQMAVQMANAGASMSYLAG